VICVVSMDWIYICSLSLHVLTVFTYVHCLYICHLANDVTFNFILITTELMLCYQWCCFVLNFYQFWAYALVPMKFRMLHNMSTCTIFVFSALFGLWWNCPTPEIIWDMSWWSRTCEELGIITSHPYCLCRYAHCFYICSLFLWCLYALSSWSNGDWHVLRPTVFVDMLTIFIDAHCVYISSLFLDMLTVFIYAHCLNICSLSLHMVTVFT
jgi:hypothetical protein